APGWTLSIPPAGSSPAGRARDERRVNIHFALRPNVDAAAGDGRNGEPQCDAGPVPRRIELARVELARNVRRIVGMENGGSIAPIPRPGLDHPDYPAGAPVRRNRRRRTRVREPVPALRRRRWVDLTVRQPERSDHVAAPERVDA